MINAVELALPQATAQENKGGSDGDR